MDRTNERKRETKHSPGGIMKVRRRGNDGEITLTD